MTEKSMNDHITGQIPNDDYESFRRWQEVTRNHFTTVVSVLLGLSTGILGFQSSLLLNKTNLIPASFHFALASLLLVFLSSTFALVCFMSRLIDFRITARIARQKFKENVEILRCEAKFYGKLSWAFFWLQIAFFTMGMSASVISILIEIYVKYSSQSCN